MVLVLGPRHVFWPVLDPCIVSSILGPESIEIIGLVVNQFLEAAQAADCTQKGTLFSGLHVGEEVLTGTVQEGLAKKWTGRDWVEKNVAGP